MNDMMTLAPLKNTNFQFGVHDTVRSAPTAFSANGTSGILISNPCVSMTPNNLRHFVKTYGSIINSGPCRSGVR